tara:strand:+ start:10094 stop:10702 length:609 start_codon:yes stop_codon:yes gene_type:complete
VLGEPEGKRYVQNSTLAGIADELSAGVTFANHLSETTARLASKFLPHEEEVIVESVDGGATDDNTCTANEELTNVVCPVGPDATKLGAQVVRAVFNFVAAFEGSTLAILFTKPSVLSLLELDLLFTRGGLGEAIIDVVSDSSFIILGAWSTGLVHENRKLVAWGNADTVLLLNVAGSDTRKIDNNVHVIDQITVSVEGNLSF